MFQTLTNNDDDPVFLSREILQQTGAMQISRIVLFRLGEIWVTAMMMMIMHMVQGITIILS